MKLILLNGPPSSGKDTAAKYYYKYGLLHKSKRIFERFSAPLKTSFAAITNRNINNFYEVEYYEEHKEEPIPWLNNTTYRQYQINLSEKHFKPLYGERVFGNLFLQRMKSWEPGSIILVPDSGFKIEISVLEEVVNPKDVLLIRTHRKDFDFSSDSRNYVYSDLFPSIDLENNGSAQDFEEKSFKLIDTFVNGTL